MTASISTLTKKIRDSEDAGAKRAAVIEMGYLTEGKAYPVLVEQLGDTNSSVQHAAVISLARHGNPEAIEELRKPKILHSPAVNVRWAAVAALGKLGDYRVIDQLLKAIDDEEWIVRNQAVTELKAKIRGIIERRDVRLARVLLRLLALEHEEIAELVVEGLVELGSRIVPVLMDVLSSPSHLIRRHASAALGLIGDERAVEPLIVRLRDPDWEVRKNGACALGRIRDKRSIEPLVQALQDHVEHVQHEAQIALAGFGKLATAPLLNTLSYEKNKFALRAIIRALGDIVDPKAVPALIEKLSSSYFVVRRAAQRALIPYGPGIVQELVPRLSYNASNIQTLLKDAADDRQTALQVRAVKALGGLEEHRAVGLLKDLVQDASPDVKDAAEQSLIQIGCAAWGRCGAVIILGEIGDEEILPRLVQSLEDDSDNVRLEAVRAIAKVDGPGAVNPLIRVARKDRDPYIRFEAVRQLRSVGVGFPQVLDFALKALKDPSRDVRSQAARLLGNFQDDRSIQPLLKATSDRHWSVRESAEFALVNFGGRAVSDLIAALVNRSWTTRFRAARLLGEIGDRRAVDALENLLRKKGERKEVKNMARQALAKLAGKLAA